MRKLCFALAGTMLSSVAYGNGLTSVSQNTVPNLDALSPQIETTTLADESFIYVDRNHELTAVRTNSTGGLSTTATDTLMPFPSYLLGAQYVANANDNRGAGTSNTQNDYLVTYTVDSPGKAYLLLDNRLTGTASDWNKSSTTDPDLGGNLSWVLGGGWVRKNTGFMPNGQADYVGIDEGATVNGPSDRNHHDAGSGNGLNNYFAIYEKDIPAAGAFTTGGTKQLAGGGNMYVVAFAPAATTPEPSVALTLGGAALYGLIRRGRRRPA